MKKIILVCILYFFVSYAFSQEREILGSWIGFNQSGTLIEWTFKDDNILVIKEYNFIGGSIFSDSEDWTFSEETTHYGIMNNYIVALQVLYNYIIIDNKLLLHNLYEIITLEKKTMDRTTEETKNLLKGKWLLLNEAYIGISNKNVMDFFMEKYDDRLYEINFLENDIIDFKVYQNDKILFSHSHLYKLEENYLFLNFDEEIDEENSIGYWYRGEFELYVYTGQFYCIIENNKLLLKDRNFDTKPMFLIKK
jgi:hypothetical protein